MMTTMAALLGGLPLMLGTGTGSELRQPLGYAMVGGLVVSQVLTLFTTPVVYLYLDRLSNWLSGWDDPGMPIWIIPRANKARSSRPPSNLISGARGCCNRAGYPSAYRSSPFCRRLPQDQIVWRREMS